MTGDVGAQSFDEVEEAGVDFFDAVGVVERCEDESECRGCFGEFGDGYHVEPAFEHESQE